MDTLFVFLHDFFSKTLILKENQQTTMSYEKYLECKELIG